MEGRGAPTRLRCCQGRNLTAFSRTGRTVRDCGVHAGHPAGCWPADTDSSALAGRGALIYGSEGWGSESLIGCCPCGRRRSSRRRKSDLCPARRAARSASALAMSRSECYLLIALSAGLLPMDIVCSLRQVAWSYSLQAGWSRSDGRARHVPDEAAPHGASWPATDT